MGTLFYGITQNYSHPIANSSQARNNVFEEMSAEQWSMDGCKAGKRTHTAGVLHRCAPTKAHHTSLSVKSSILHSSTRWNSLHRQLLGLWTKAAFCSSPAAHRKPCSPSQLVSSSLTQENPACTTPSGALFAHTTLQQFKQTYLFPMQNQRCLTKTMMWLKLNKLLTSKDAQKHKKCPGVTRQPQHYLYHLWPRSLTANAVNFKHTEAFACRYSNRKTTGTCTKRKDAAVQLDSGITAPKFYVTRQQTNTSHISMKFQTGNS